MNQSPNPWHVSFSYARALQNTVLKTWAGDDAKKDEAQAILATPRQGERQWRSLASSLLATSPTLSLSPPSRRTTSVRFFPTSRTYLLLLIIPAYVCLDPIPDLLLTFLSPNHAMRLSQPLHQHFSKRLIATTLTFHSSKSSEMRWQ